MPKRDGKKSTGQQILVQAGMASLLSARLALHDADRPEPRDLPGDSGAVDHLHHAIDVLVYERRLLSELGVARATHEDPRAVSSSRKRCPATCRLAAPRLMARPAPWQVLANEISRASSVPART